MSVTVVAIPNPLRMGDRTVSMVEPGVPVSAAFPDGWPRAYIRVNGEESDPDRMLCVGDHVVLIRQPEATLVSIAINILVSIAISVAFALLFPPPKPKQKRDDESSPTYGFGGISSNRAEGQPIPIVYGRMKVGGTIANEFVDVQGLPPRSTLRQLISFGEGEISAIGGISTDTASSSPLIGAAIPSDIEINGNPAQNFSGVKAWLRMGTNEQELIPGFNETRSTFAVDSELVATETSTTTTSTLVLNFSVAGDDEFTDANDAAWDRDGVSFDFNTEDVDGFVVTLRMPEGWYRTDTATGATVSAFLSYQIRYIELDGGGSPIASGGYDGDGYVRLPVVGPLALRQRSPFSAQNRGRFLNPQTYQPSTPGTALLTDDTALSQARYALGAAGHAEGAVISLFGGFAWVKIGAVGEQLIFDTHNGATRGFQLGIFDVTFGSLGFQTDRKVLAFKFGGNGLFNTFHAGNGSPFTGFNPPTSVADGLFESDAVGQWVHVGFRYIRNNSIQLCVNGRVISTVDDVSGPNRIDLEWHRRFIAVGDTIVSSGTGMAIDEAKLYNGGIGAAEFAADYANGEGFAGAALGLETAMVFRASYEDSAGTNESTSSGQWWAATPTLGLNATSGVEEGIVRSGLTGDLKRSQYRIEVLRVTRKSTSSTVANTLELQDVQSVISESLTYPNSPLLGLEIDATEQLNDSVPQVTAVLHGILCPIWDGESTQLPSIRFEWSANPAWISLELITNARYGLGKFYDFRSVDLGQWLSWANYCDEIVFDGRGRVTIDNPGTANDADVYFDNALLDPDTGEARGEIWFEIGIEEQPTLPDTWEVGTWLRFANMPTDTEVGVANDIDSPDTEGYEIWDLSLVDGVWTVKCFWDRLDETDPWTSGNRLGADILTPTDLDGGTVEGGSRRFEFNGVFDKIQPAWDALLDICATGRAVPVPEGSRMSLRYSHPRDPVGVLTPSNIVAGTFVCDFSSERTRPNALTLNILDREQGYEPVPVQVQTSDLETVTNQTFIRQENQQLFGVTDAGQAERQGNYILLINKHQRRSGKFDAALDALPYQVGDLLRVSSEVLPRGGGGLIAATSSATKESAITDREVFSGGAWSATSVTATDNVDTDPYGDTVADRLDGTGFIEQSIDFDFKVDGWVSVSIFAKAGTSTLPAIQIITDRATAEVTFDLSAETVSAITDDFDVPARATIRDAGSSWRYCTFSVFIKALDGAATTSTLDLRIYPRQGDTTGTCVFSKVLATQAEHAAAGVDFRGFVIDTDVTVSGSSTNTVTLQDFRGNIVTGTIDTTATPAGSYGPGDTLFLSAGPGTVPTRGAPFIVSTLANELVIEISGIRRTSDMSASFDWVEYIPLGFIDDAKEDPNRGGLIARVPDQTEIGGIAPSSPESLTVGDSLNEPRAGNFAPEIVLSWEHAIEGRSQLTGSRIYWRDLPDDTPTSGGWQLAATVRGLEADARILVPSATVGAVIELSVVPLTRAYPDTPPGTGIRTTLKLRGLSWNPEGPTTLSTMIGGTMGTYDVSYASAVDGPDLTDVLRTEIRRGGWVLGQPVGVTEEGSRTLGPTFDIWEALSDVTVGRLHARSLSRAVTYSPETTLDVSLVPMQDLSEVPDISMGAEEEWETSEGGDWEAAIPDINGPTITGDLVQNAAGELEFDVSGLSGGYTTRHDGAVSEGLEQSRQPRPLLVMAAVEAEQVHPLEFQYAQFQFGSLEMQRWSFEGPTSPASDDLANCRLQIKIRTNIDGTSGGWSEYEPFVPGVYTAVEVQLRLVVTRPDTTYNIRIKKFHHKVVVPTRSLVEQGTRDLHARQEII